MNKVPEGFVTRAMMAELLGVTIHEINRRVKENNLRPARRLKGMTLYTMEQVEKERLRSRNPMVRPVAPPVTTRVEATYTGEEAAKVFAELRASASLDEIVVKTSVHPEAVLAIASAYARTKGGLFISKDALSRLEELPLDGSFPVRDGDELAELLARSLDDTCEACRRRPRSSRCPSCTVASSRRANANHENADV